MTKHSRLLLRFIASAAILLGLAFLRPALTEAASLKELQDKLAKAEQDLAKYQQLATQENQKSDTYSAQISKTEQDIAGVKSTIDSLSSQITTKEGDIDSTNSDIDGKIADLNTLDDQRNESLASYYEFTRNIDEVQMVADDHDLSHSIDQMEYINALQDQILGTIDKTNAIKQDLESNRSKLEQQKADLAALKGEQVAKSLKLASVQTQNKSLFQRSQANEAQYAEMTKKLESQKHSLANEIYELRKRLQSNNEINVGGSSGYPWRVGANVWIADPWGFYKGECTSYAAWKWNVAYGRPFTNTRPGDGDAANWPALARDQGYNVVSSPKAGAIVSWPINSGRGMPYGHVAIVEAVHGDGTIDVSEYNWGAPHSFSQRNNVRPTDYGSPRYIVP